MQAPSTSTGMFSALRGLLDSAFGALQNRVELFAVEVKEEKAQMVELLVWLSVSLFLGMMAVIVLSGIIIFSFPAESRMYAAAGLLVIYAVGAAFSVARVKRLGLERDKLPFADTINELKKDREWVNQ